MSIFDYINEDTKNETIIEIYYEKNLEPPCICNVYGDNNLIEKINEEIDSYYDEYLEYFNRGDGNYFFKVIVYTDESSGGYYDNMGDLGRVGWTETNYSYDLKKIGFEKIQI